MYRSIDIPEKDTCTRCGGTGKLSGVFGEVKCEDCDGSGKQYYAKTYSIPNSDKNNCGNCKFGIEFEPKHDKCVACCRYPPQNRMRGTSLVTSGINVDPVVMVDKTYWCGEHKPKVD